MYKNILVPIDGSDNSMSVLQNAVKLSKFFEGHITIFHAMHISIHQTYSGKMGAVYHQLRETVAEVAQEIMEKAREEAVSNNISFNEKTVWGDPAEEILLEAEQGKYDLIIIGCRGLSEVKSWVLGSVSNKVIRHATCPVLVVR